MNKFEKLIEYIINDEDQKARELFHDIVVEKSRDIYESIMSEEDMEENVHGYETKDLTQEIAAEEQMGEDEEFDLDHEEGDEVAGDMPADDMDHSGEEHEEHEEIEDKVMNIDAKLDELLAKFDEIMGDEGHDEMGAEEPAMGHEEPEMEEMGMMEADDEQVEEGKNPFAKDGSGKSGSAMSGKSGKSGSAQSGKSGKSGKPFESKSSSELMREYVEKIQDMNLTGASEGEAVGAAGKKVAVNTKSEVGPGNNFGGDAVTSHGGEQNQDGTSPTKASNEYTKGQGEIKSGNRNVPGGKADNLESTGKEYSKEHPADGTAAGNDGKLSQNTKSVQAQNTGKK